MVKPNIKYNRILSYLKSKLSNRQRHDFEKEMMRESFDEEAFDGLSSLPVNELEEDILKLKQNIKELTRKEKRLPAYFLIKIAASILIITGLAVAIKFSLKQNTGLTITEKIAENKEIPFSKSYTLPIPEQPVIQRKISGTAENKDQLAFKETETEEMVTNETEISTQPEAAMESKVVEEVKPEAGAKAVAPEKLKSVSKEILRARVTDSQGVPLPGVSIFEKGTSNGAITNVDGEFELKVSGTNAILDLSYVGYQSLEINPDSAKNHDIKMDEDLLALDEVVVVGYGTQKKSDLTGAVSRVTSDEISSENKAEVVKIDPIPPTGSYSSFKKSIYSKFNYSQFKDFKGKYKVVVEFMIYSNGSVGNFSFKQPVDPGISSEIKQLILNNGKWKPGMLGDQKTDSKVKLRLSFDFDNSSEITP
jgi:hypothetical protein